MSVAPKSVLYIRPDSIGDLVVFTSALAELQAAWPDAQHTLLVRPGYEADLSSLFSAQLQWLVTPVNPFNQRPGEVQEALSLLFAELEKRAVDLIIAPTLNRTWLEVAIAAHFPAARRVALGRRPVDPLFSNALRLELGVEDTGAFSEIVPADEQKFDWDNNHRLVDHLLERPTPRSYPQLTLPVAAQDAATAILAERNLAPDGFVAVFIGGLANVPIKSWPSAAFAQLVHWLQEEKSLPVLLLGHETEAGDIEDVVLRLTRLGGKTPPIWLGRDGEVSRLAALLAQAKVYVGHDTGAMHIAAALDRPVVGIFGGGHWPRFRAVGRRVISVVQPLPCFGCNWDCHFGHAPCVKTITPKEVIGAVEMALSDRRATYDHVWDVRILSDESINLIQVAAPHYAAVQSDRMERLHLIERLTREIGIRNTEIAALKRESRIKDQKVIALGQEVAEKGVELTTLQEQPQAGLRAAQRLPVENKEGADEATQTAAREEVERELAHLKTLVADKAADVESLQDLVNERAAAHRKRESLTKYLQKSLAEKDEAYGQLDKENRRLALLVEEKTIDHAFWTKTMGDKDVHIRNLDAIIAQLRSDLRTAVTAPVKAEESKAPSAALELPPETTAIEEMDLLKEPPSEGKARGWKDRLRFWLLARVRSWLMPAAQRTPRHTPVRREKRVRNESIRDSP